MEELKKCPFCGFDGIYELILTNSIGDSEPALFCNICKMTFQVENDSPYMNDDETYIYLRKKLYKKFNTRKPMEHIVERLDSECKKHCDATKAHLGSDENDLGLRHLGKANAFSKAIEIVKEELY